MVKKRCLQETASMTIEMVTALAIAVTVILPLGLSFNEEQHLCHVYYWHAVAMEAIDGEMEVLAAGEWRSLAEGEHPYVVHAEAAKYLPAGQFTLAVHGPKLRLEWRPGKMQFGGPIVREAVGR